jgi:hypothetical protein
MWNPVYVKVHEMRKASQAIRCSRKVQGALCELIGELLDANTLNVM